MPPEELINYVRLEEGIPKRLRFSEAWEEKRLIIDPITKRTKEVTAYVLRTVEEDGVPVDKTFSVLARKLFELLKPFIDDGTIFQKTFEITKTGKGFLTEYSVRVVS